ncbi:MAG: hypothetical protein MMC23_008924 [Stictis urceolatum]|nr:hypothetical protein [Stictis urceolata]
MSTPTKINSASTKSSAGAGSLFFSSLEKARAAILQNSSACPPNSSRRYRSHSPNTSKLAAKAAIEAAQRELLTEDLQQQALDAYVQKSAPKVIANLKEQHKHDVEKTLRKDLAPAVAAQLKEEMRGEVRAELKGELEETVRAELHAAMLAEHSAAAALAAVHHRTSGSMSAPSRRDSGTSVIDPSTAGSIVDLSQDSDSEDHDGPVYKGPPPTKSRRIDRLEPVRAPNDQNLGSSLRKRSFDEALDDGGDHQYEDAERAMKRQLTETLMNSAEAVEREQAIETVESDNFTEDESENLAGYGAYDKYGSEDIMSGEEQEEEGSEHPSDYVKEEGEEEEIGEQYEEDGEDFGHYEEGAEGEEYEEDYEEGAEEVGEVEKPDTRSGTQTPEVIDLLSDSE